MVLRVARHTEQLQALVDFYTLIPGIEVLGDFQSHDGYDGVFLGMKNENWHLEFTTSNHEAKHNPDPDDLLVFYLEDVDALNEAGSILKHRGHLEQQSRNPYWNLRSLLFIDPDGFGLVLSVKK